jgi:CubicO group peptidase (beta-lactamase class C family)
MATFSTDPDETLQRLFQRQIDVGLHHGAQLAVYRQGDLVLDLAGGTTGPEGGETTADQQHILFSCTKPFVAVCVHQLVEDGDLSYDDPIVDHWSEFADEGTAKAGVTVRQVLAHHSGINESAFDERPDLWHDWDAAVAAMEDAEPTLEPGTPGYQTLTYGWILGELVRRVTGTPVEEYLQANLFGPLGMDGTTLGADDADDVATLAGFEEFDRCRDPGEGLESMTPPEAAAAFNEPSVLESVVPAATSVGTARDVARFYGCLANGGAIDETRILERETVDAMTSLHGDTRDDGTLSRPMRYALGVWVGGAVNDAFGTLSGPETFGHLGLGSIAGWGDSAADLGFAYVTNGIREESFEHWARVNTVADAVRQTYR